MWGELAISQQLALGRHTPVRIDDFESMRFLLTEPREFVKHELERGAEPKGPSLFD
jgi:hypothetical protein